MINFEQVTLNGSKIGGRLIINGNERLLNTEMYTGLKNAYMKEMDLQGQEDCTIDTPKLVVPIDKNKKIGLDI